MSSEHLPIRLDSIAAINPTRRVKKGSQVPFIEMAALPQHSRDIVSTDVSTRIAKGAGAHFQNGDTLLARITPCLENGKTSQVNCLPDDVVGEGSTEFIVLSGIEPEDNDFIYYLCRNPDFRQYAIGRMEGTSGRQRVSWQSIAAYEFECSSPNERRSAANLLSVIDDRITLLRETNATLESIAQAIFKSWFIDFDPVRAKQEGCASGGMDAETAALFPDGFEESELGLIPKGWRVGVLSDAFEVNPLRSLSKRIEAPYLEMANTSTVGHRPLQRIEKKAFGSGCKFKNGDALLAKITPCLENGKSAFVDFLADNEVGWGSTEFIVLRSRPLLPAYCAYLLVRHEPFRKYAIQAMTGTSGRQRVELSRLLQFKLALPPDEKIAEAVREVFDCLQLRISEYDVQAKSLESLRDILLTRLISGQLRLPDAEALSEEFAHP